MINKINKVAKKVLNVKDAISTRVDITSSETPFLVTTIDNGDEYIVKIPNYKNSSMFKEYLANQIAFKLDIQTPIGCLIRYNVQEEIIDRLQEQVDEGKVTQQFFDNVNILQNYMPEVTLFGIKYLDSMKKNQIELLHDLKEGDIDSENIYKSFSFDQLLVNGDRHFGNILIVDSKVYLIDHDRIFFTQGRGLELFDRIRNQFDCLKQNHFNDFLYKYITNKKQKDSISKYASEIKDKLDYEFLESILKYFYEHCPRDVLQYSSNITVIADFISYRAENIKQCCETNIKGDECYG